jgi:hypothetical protein
MRRTQSYVGHVLLNRQIGESETLSGFANTRGSTIVHTETERPFKPGERVRNTKTGETGVVVDVAYKDIGTTPVIYDKEFEEWGSIWDTPNHRLELVS